LVRTTYPTVTRLYWYKDRADSTNPAEAQYGLVYPDGSPAPALGGLRATLGTTITAPTAPTGVTVSTKSGYVNTTWKAPAGSTVTGYRVELRQVNSTAVTVVNVSGTTLSARLATRRGVTYRVAVAAVNSAGTSPFTISGTFTGR
ncbi:MAG: fibronectin type III domain-containing protein, partial [Candidatus Nanopelagicales bacterium]